MRLSATALAAGERVHCITTLQQNDSYSVLIAGGRQAQVQNLLLTGRVLQRHRTGFSASEALGVTHILTSQVFSFSCKTAELSLICQLPHCSHWILDIQLWPASLQQCAPVALLATNNGSIMKHACQDIAPHQQACSCIDQHFILPSATCGVITCFVSNPQRQSISSVHVEIDREVWLAGETSMPNEDTAVQPPDVGLQRGETLVRQILRSLHCERTLAWIG